MNKQYTTKPKGNIPFKLVIPNTGYEISSICCHICGNQICFAGRGISQLATFDDTRGYIDMEITLFNRYIFK